MKVILPCRTNWHSKKHRLLQQVLVAVGLLDDFVVEFYIGGRVRFLVLTVELSGRCYDVPLRKEETVFQAAQRVNNNFKRCFPDQKMQIHRFRRFYRGEEYCGAFAIPDGKGDTFCVIDHWRK